MKKVKLVLVWFFSIISLIFGICSTSFTISNVLFILAGLCIMPPIVNKITVKTDKYTRKIKWGMFIVLTLFAYGTVPVADTVEVGNTVLEQSIESKDDKLLEENKKIAKESKKEELVEKQDEVIEKTEKEEIEKQTIQENVRKQVGEQANQIAEEQARKQVEEQAKQVTEEQARKQAEEQAKQVAEEQSRKQAEEQAKQVAEEQARKQAEEQAKQVAEEQARKQAEEQARQVAEAQARKQAEEAKKQNSEITNPVVSGNGSTVYRTPSGKRYHLDPDCGGKNSSATTIDSARAAGLTPCQKCAN